VSTEQKVVVVTGTSRGVGEAIVKAYRIRNYVVVGTSRSIAPSSHPDFLTIGGDIADPETGRRVIDAALERFGRIDTLINNAGIFSPGPFEKYTEQNYKDVLATNLNGFLFITQKAIEVMLKQANGHVVQITTTRACQLQHSCAAGVDNQRRPDRGLAIEDASRGIRVNAVAPGAIKTSPYALETHEAVGMPHPLKRTGEPEDIAQAILYLEDASFVTGEILHVDGDKIAGH